MNQHNDESASKKSGCGCLGFLGCGCLTIVVLALITVFLIQRFCISGVSLKVSPETTLLTEPLKTNGKSIDYFAVIKEAREQNRPAGQNGFRTVLQFYGKPAVLDSKQFGDWQYTEMCKTLDTDPNVAAKGTLVRPDGFLQTDNPVQAKADEEQFPEAEVLGTALSSEKQKNTIISNVWTLEEHPKMKDWLETINEGLDTVCGAVLGNGQPEHYYRIPLVRRDENDFCFLAYPLGAVAFHQELTKALRIRSMYRFGTEKKEDTELAWKDFLTTLYLARLEGMSSGQLFTDGTVPNFGGFSDIPAELWSTGLFDVLTHLKNVTPEQLGQWIQNIEALPNFADRKQQLDWFQYLILDAAGSAHSLKETYSKLDALPPSHSLGAMGTLGFNSNILAKRINVGFALFRIKLDAAADYEALTKLLNSDDNTADLGAEFEAKLAAMGGGNAFMSFITVSGRSVLAGDIAGVVLPQWFGCVLGQQLFEETNVESLRLVLSLQKYKSEKGKYPETLDELNLKPSGLKIPSEYKKTEKGYTLKTGSGKITVEYEK